MKKRTFVTIEKITNVIIDYLNVNLKVNFQMIKVNDVTNWEFPAKNIKEANTNSLKNLS